MYEFLDGVVAERGAGHVVLDVHGVGWLLVCSQRTTASLDDGARARLRVHLHVTENAHTLYGFASPAERALFRRLLQVSGIGPTSAIGLVSALPPDELARTILDGDVGALTRIRGVGRKTAERLVVELRDHLAELAAPAAGAPAGESGDELAQVLRGLGSPPREADRLARAAREALGPQAEFQALLRHALQTGAPD